MKNLYKISLVIGLAFVFSLGMAISARAQSVAGTTWEASPELWTIHTYQFLKGGKVQCLEEVLNSRETIEGKWTQSGNTIKIEMPEWQIKATIEGDQMEAVMVFKSGKQHNMWLNKKTQTSKQNVEANPPQPVPNPKPKEEIPSAILRGDEHFKAGRFDEAIRAYTEATKLAPEFAVRAYKMLGSVYLKTAKLLEARKAYDEAIKLAPNDAESYVLRGEVAIFDQTQNPKLALLDYDHAIKISPNYGFAFHNRAWAQLILGNGKNAALDAREYLKLKGWRDSSSAYMAVVAYFGERKERRSAESKQLLDEAGAKLDPADTSPPALFIRFLLDRIKPAEFDAATGDINKQTERQTYVGMYESLNGKTEQALKHLRWVEANGNRLFFEYLLALEEIERLTTAPAATPTPAQDKPRLTLTNYMSAMDLAFSPDGKMIVAAGRSGSGMWDVQTGTERKLPPLEKQLHLLYRGKVNLHSVALSRDGQILAANAYANRGTIQLWDVQSSKWIKSLDVLSADVIAFSHDGKMLASAFGSKITLWDLSSGTHKELWYSDRGDVNALAFSPDGKTLASVNGRTTTILWNIATGKTLQTLPSSDNSTNGQIHSIAFSPDSKMLAIGEAQVARAWELSSGQVKVLDKHSGRSEAIAFSPNGKTLAVGAFNSIFFYAMPSGTLTRKVVPQPSAVTALAFSPDGKTLASGGRGVEIKLWDVNDAGMSSKLPDLSDPNNIVPVYSPSQPTQVASVVPSIENTQWSDAWFGECYFDKGGKVRWVRPLLKSNFEGTWKQTGNTVEMEFSNTDSKIKATIKGNRLEGTQTDRHGNIAPWSVAKIVQPANTKNPNQGQTQSNVSVPSIENTEWTQLPHRYYFNKGGKAIHKGWAEGYYTEEGTWKQTGDVIEIEFSDGTKIKATIKDNRMEGTKIYGDSKTGIAHKWWANKVK